MLATPNPDLPRSYMIPGVFTFLDTTGAGGTLANAAKRLLLWGYKSSAGSAIQDAVAQVTSQTEVNRLVGRGSDLARLFGAALSQVGAGVVETFILPLAEPSGGTASTHLIKVYGPATSSGSIDLWICGYRLSVRVASGDTASIIAAAIEAEIDLLLDLPVTAGVVTDTITLTYRHKGLVGNDLPIQARITGASGVKLSPGAFTLATNASGAGSITVQVGATTLSAAIANLDTPTVVATAITAAINATGSSPVTAESAVGEVTLYYANDRAIRRPVVTIVTSTGITSTPAFGTAGAGAPSLTAPLTALTKQEAFWNWVSPFSDAASLGALATHIESYADGRNQKNQTGFFCSIDALATGGALQTASSPSLATTPRWHESWCPDSPQQAYELAARHAAVVLAEDYVAKNFDGVEIKAGFGSVPLLYPHALSRPGIDDDCQAALASYRMTPLVVQNGKLVILRGRTTYSSSDQRLWDTSTIRNLDYYRIDLNQFLKTRFKQKSIKTLSASRTSLTVSPKSVKDAVIERIKLWDDNDIFDGIDTLKKLVVCEADAVVPTRLNVNFPMSPPRNLHQIGAYGGLV